MSSFLYRYRKGDAIEVAHGPRWFRATVTRSGRYSTRAMVPVLYPNGRESEVNAIHTRRVAATSNEATS